MQQVIVNLQASQQDNGVNSIDHHQNCMAFDRVEQSLVQVMTCTLTCPLSVNSWTCQVYIHNQSEPTCSSTEILFTQVSMCSLTSFSVPQNSQPFWNWQWYKKLESGEFIYPCVLRIKIFNGKPDLAINAYGSKRGVDFTWLVRSWSTNALCCQSCINIKILITTVRVTNI
jgi:hypothetical protein